MKKLLTLFAIMHLFWFTAAAQEPAGDLETLAELNQQVVQKFRAGELKEAQELGTKAMDETIRVLGPTSIEAANSYLNLGEIYASQKKYSYATFNFNRSLQIYRLDPDQNEKMIIRVLDSLALTLTVDGKKDDAEKIVEDLMKSARAAYGQESKKLLPYIITARSFYIYIKKYDKAETLFPQQYRLTREIFGPDSSEAENVSDEFYCYLSRFKLKERSEKQAAFNEAARKDYVAQRVSEPKKINGGVVNGKAIYLPVPVYPKSARDRGARGLVEVKVLIDETGMVVSARAICNVDLDLKLASEAAAFGAKFRPTTLEGKLVKVSGSITYVFN